MGLRLSLGLLQTAAFDGCGGHGDVAKGRLRNHTHHPFLQLLKKGVRGKGERVAIPGGTGSRRPGPTSC